MDREAMQQLVEEILSLQVQASEASDNEDYGASWSLEKQSEESELLLNVSGYTLEEDSDNLDIIHVLSADGTRVASFHMAEWRWQQTPETGNKER